MIKDYVAFDLETTGLNVETDYIIEIGALKVKNGKVCERFMEFLKPPTPISAMITNITGITNEMVASSRNTPDIIRDFVDFCGDFVLLGHNIMFDYKLDLGKNNLLIIYYFIIGSVIIKLEFLNIETGF